MTQPVDEEMLNWSVSVGIQQAYGSPDDKVLFQAVKEKVKAALIRPLVRRVIFPSFEPDLRPMSERFTIEQSAVLLAMNHYHYECGWSTT